MDIVSKVTAFITKNSLIEDKEIIVGCSGGADSVALLRILNETNHDRIHVVHVNHNLRGEDARLDEVFVVSLCEKLGLPCKVYSYDIEAQSHTLKRSLEDTGRILRYQSFNEYAQLICGKEYLEKTIIAVAHHKDDLAETMLMNLFRGTGVDGLVSPSARNGNVIRPLLCITKQEILEYLKLINQDYRTDASNFELDCTRNIWRNDIIPRISKAANKNPTEALFSTYELLSDDVAYLDKVTNEVMTRVFDRETRTISVDLLRNEDKAVQSRVVRKLWLNTFGNLTDLERVHVDAILRLFVENKSSGVTINLPFNRVAFVVDGKGGVCTEDELSSRSEEMFTPKGYIFNSTRVKMLVSDVGVTATNFPQLGSFLSARIVENISDLEYNCYSWVCPILKDDEDMELVLGPVDLSLKFGRAGSDSHKTVQRLLMDRKIPMWLRERVFGVSKGEEILLIPGVGHSIGFTDEVSMRRFLESFNGIDAPKKYLVLTF